MTSVSTWKALIDEVNARAERQREIHATHLLDVARWLQRSDYPLGWHVPGEPCPACLVTPLAIAHRDHDLARQASGELAPGEEVEPLDDYIAFIAETARGERVAPRPEGE